MGDKGTKAERREYIDHLVDELNMHSTPGFPVNLAHANNYLALSHERDFITDMASERLERWLVATPEDFERWHNYPSSILFEGIRDPNNVFGKDEPHPRRKLEAKVFRQICGVSIIDQLVERALFSRWSLALLELYPTLACAIGIGFSDRQLAEFGSKISGLVEKRGTLRSCDVKGWDSRVSDWMLQADIDIVASLAPSTGFTGWATAARTWAVTASNCSYVINGKVYCKTIPGLTISGSYRTTHSNSVMRLLIAALAGDTAVVAGDDSLEWGSGTNDEMIDRYAAMGFELREVVAHDVNSFNFCSHSYVRKDGVWVASLDGWTKSLFKLIAGACAPEQVAAFWHETRYNSEDVLSRCARVLSRYPVEIPAEN
jgi:hypothetical protein